MKKVFLTLFAVLLAVPAFAIEVYNNGDNSVDIYGNFRGYAGYGLSVAGDNTQNIGGANTITNGSFGHNMMYGLQNNSRIGTNIKVGNFTAQFELGANEKTLVTQATGDTIGIRKAWGAYTFGNGSRLLFGKTDTPTAMGGFNSSFYDTDNGLNGFGGTTTGHRRFQVQYSIAGLTLALIEDDVTSNASVGGFTDNAPYTPRAGISYEFKNDALLAKIAATYTAVTFGVKPTFGNMWVSILARYGMNEDLYGEAKTVANHGGYVHSAYSISLDPTGTGTPITISNRTFNADGSFNNTHRAGAALEFGINVTENFAAVIGGGYQATIQEIGDTLAGVPVTDPSCLIHSYAVFVQTPYKLSNNFALVPEIAWFGTIGKASANTTNMGKVEVSDSQSGLLVGVQFRATF